MNINQLAEKSYMLKSLKYELILDSFKSVIKDIDIILKSKQRGGNLCKIRHYFFYQCSLKNLDYKWLSKKLGINEKTIFNYIHEFDYKQIDSQELLVKFKKIEKLINQKFEV